VRRKVEFIFLEAYPGLADCQYLRLSGTHQLFPSLMGEYFGESPHVHVGIVEQQLQALDVAIKHCVV